MRLAICGGEKLRLAPFTQWPLYSEKEFIEIVDLLKETPLFRGINFPSYWYGDLSTKSNFIEKFEMDFSKLHDCKYGFCLNSGTTALDLSLKALDLTKEDEVLVSPYTYFASASSIKKSGAKPVFVDIEAQTLNMDPLKAAESISSKTKGMVIVHFGGIPADMEKYKNLAVQNNLWIVEDCCHTAYASIDGKSVGSFGRIGCFSFQSSKLISSGEGGAIVTNDLQTAEYIYSHHNGGREHLNSDRESFLYLGGNYRLSSANIAMLCVGMKNSYQQFFIRERNVGYFKSRIKQIPGVTLIDMNNDRIRRDYYIIALRFNKSEFKGLSLKRFVLALNAEGIPCSTGYKKALYEHKVLLSEQADWSQYREKCTETVKALEEIIWLSHWLFLGNTKDMDDIINAIIKVKESVDELVRNR